MSRGLHSDITTELAKGKFTMVHLVALTLGTFASPSVYYYTDAPNDLTESGDTYLANGFLLGLGAISESQSMSVGNLNLTISGVNQTIISQVLNNGYLYKTVTIKRAFLDSSNDLISSNSVYTCYKGLIAGMQIADKKDSSIIQFTLNNHWSSFGKISGRMTTPDSQHQFYSPDYGFDRMASSNKKA
jgi:hypothetical protein